jgi:hypothetical protein
MNNLANQGLRGHITTPSLKLLRGDLDIIAPYATTGPLALKHHYGRYSTATPEWPMGTYFRWGIAVTCMWHLRFCIGYDIA